MVGHLSVLPALLLACRRKRPPRAGPERHPVSAGGLGVGARRLPRVGEGAPTPVATPRARPSCLPRGPRLGGPAQKTSPPEPGVRGTVLARGPCAALRRREHRRFLSVTDSHPGVKGRVKPRPKREEGQGEAPGSCLLWCRWREFTTVR